MTTRAVLLRDAGASLAEGPVWDEQTKEIVWVDILRGQVHRTNVDGTRDEVIQLREHVGCVALAESGDMVAGTTSGFRLVDSSAGHPLLAPLPDAGPHLRMNDGKVDPAGRFLAGTMAYDEEPGAGSLWSFDGDNIRRLLDDVTISNGLAWSADGETMFYIDTPTRRVDAFDYDVADGSISGRRCVVQLEEGIGDPDGMAIDVEGGLWVALWGGGAIHRYEDGRLTTRVEVSDPLTTSCAFVGETRRQLLVTTAGTDPSRPDGSLHVIDVPVAGAPTARLRLPAIP